MRFNFKKNKTKTMNTTIAVILTCFNRKNKTTACLKLLFKACKYYNTLHPSNALDLSIYLTDDGCTDGTAEAVSEICQGYDLHITKGNGHCYWAGGMRLAWREALKSSNKWDFFLLLNDDTMMMENAFDSLFAMHKYAIKTFLKPGLYSGMTCDIANPDIITYGGEILKGKIQADGRKVGKSEKPQLVDQANANILLVPSEIVSNMGIFHEGFRHGGADYDYSMQAHKQGYPILVSPKVCGACEYDHLSTGEEVQKLAAMSLKERIAYFKNPIHSDDDYLLYIKRNLPHKLILCWILRKIRIMTPLIYGKICKLRGLQDV